MIDAPHDAPAYVLEFGYALASVYEDPVRDPSRSTWQACTVKMTVRSDGAWTVDAGQYVPEFGWENLPTTALTGGAQTPAIDLLRWLAETVTSPEQLASVAVDGDHRS